MKTTKEVLTELNQQADKENFLVSYKTLLENKISYYVETIENFNEEHIKHLNEQFDRLLSTNRVSVRDSYYIIFSDYMTINSVSLIDLDNLSDKNRIKVLKYIETLDK